MLLLPYTMKDAALMFSPSQEQVRRFFCAVYRKQRDGLVMDAMEHMLAQWIQAHPEYWPTLADEDLAVQTNYDSLSPEGSQSNPFLHLSMHLSIAEQCSIDQPAGVRRAVEQLTSRLGDTHAAHHAAMEALGTMLWQAQQDQKPPDGHAYVDALLRKASARQV